MNNEMAYAVEKKMSFVLTTSAKDEEQYLEKTIVSVSKQTVRPIKWLIVDDGSCDNTEIIARKMAKQLDFIEVLSRKREGKANFGSKAASINMAVARIGRVPYEYIGVLDADITLEQNYFERLLNELNAAHRVGIGGGLIYEKYGEKWKPLQYNYEMSVAGAVQMFRARCFNRIGGYLEIETGGIDTMAETMARMYGWRVCTFEKIPVYHHRVTGSKSRGRLKTCYCMGKQEYNNGYSMIFELFKFFAFVKEKPIVLNSLARLLGFLVSFLGRKEIRVPEEVVRFLKEEQLKRIVHAINKAFQAL